MTDEAKAVPMVKKKRKRLKPDERRAKLRDRLWPDAAQVVWHRLENDGFITVPKLLPLICGLFKMLATNDPTRVYLDLWCRSFDGGLIENIDEDEAAYTAGYTGTRAKRTWTEHMHELSRLGFIRVAAEGNREIGHVLLVNPLEAAHKLRNRSKSTKFAGVPDEWWNAYLAWAGDVGAVLPSDEET